MKKCCWMFGIALWCWGILLATPAGAADALSGDGLDQVVKWRGKSDLSSLAGKEVRVQFSLRQSALYTWQFR